MGLFGGKLPEFSIQLERPDGVYYAGETVRARVGVSAEDGGKFREIRAGLLLEEKYQTIERQRDSDGDRSYNRVWRTSEHWAAREQLAAGELPKGFSRAFDFEWRLPEAAQPSCQGKIVAARWLVKATADRKLARDVNAETQFYVVRPPSAAPASPVENSAPDAASMRFELQRSAFVQGESVAGRVVVEPRQDLSPRALQLSLVRHEVVPGGDRTNVEEIVEARHDYPAQLRAGQPAAFDFTFAIPSNWCPSYHSANARVEWRLNATLDLAWKRDVHGWQAIQVFNGAPQMQPASSAPEPSGPNLCRSCGGALAPGARFCGNCGAQVTGT